MIFVLSGYHEKLLQLDDEVKNLCEELQCMLFKMCKCRFKLLSFITDFSFTVTCKTTQHSVWMDLQKYFFIRRYMYSLTDKCVMYKDVRNHCPYWSMVKCNYKIDLFKYNKTYEQLYESFKKSSALHILNTLPCPMKVIIFYSSDSWGNHRLSYPEQEVLHWAAVFLHYHKRTSVSLSNIMQASVDQTTTSACLFSDSLCDMQLSGTNLPSC